MNISRITISWRFSVTITYRLSQQFTNKQKITRQSSCVVVELKVKSQTKRAAFTVVTPGELQ